MDFLAELEDLALEEGVMEKEGYKPKFYNPSKYRKKPVAPAQKLKNRLRARKNRYKIKQYNKMYRRKHKNQLKRRNQLSRKRRVF